MSNATLPAVGSSGNGQTTIAIDQDAVLKAVGLNAHDPKAQALLLVCNRYHLDPILKHIVLIQGTIYVTRDGLLSVAHRSGQLDGIVVEEQGETQTHHVAKVAVYRKDMRHPFTYVGRYPKAGSNKAYGPEMAVKCAEVMALRRAFNVALCAREEMWDSEDGAPEPRAHHAVNHSNDTGHGRTGAYAGPKAVAEYKAWLKGFVDDCNAKWLDRHVGPDGEVTPGVKEILSTFQVTNHLIKWAVSEGALNAPDDARPGQRDGFAAVVWERNRGGLIAEAEDYARRKWREAKQALEAAQTPEPEDTPDPEFDEADIPEPGSAG